MRKIFIAIVALFGCIRAYALPSGNPLEPAFFNSRHCREPSCCFLPFTSHFDFFNCGWPSKFDFRVGYYGDFVFDRNMEKNTGANENLHNFKLQTNAGYLAIAFCDTFEIYGTLGASNIEFGGSNRMFRMGVGANSVGSFETDSAFSWSIGLRAILFEWENFILGAQGQYFRTVPHLKKYVNGFDGRPTYINGQTITYDECQGSIGLSYLAEVADWAILSPYTSLTVSRGFFDGNNFQFINASANLVTLHDFRSQKKVGYAIGVSLVTYDLVAITAEGRWVSEKALYINGNFRF